jgi:progressive ankylosis protein
VQNYRGGRPAGTDPAAGAPGGFLFRTASAVTFAAMPTHRSAAWLARSQRAIFLFWAPLAAQWVMMALEGPFLAAVIARMGDPVHNLAAYGVAFALAILVESPVIMLMSASIALVDDGASYRRMRAFANALNAGATALLLLVLVPPVYAGLMVRLLGLPQTVVNLVYGALWLLLPWPAAIGYRRFVHGVLIRAGLTRRVAYGTVLRLAGMAAAATLLYAYTDIPGAWVGAAALSAGVCTEALAARAMAAGVIRGLLAGTLDLRGADMGDEAAVAGSAGGHAVPAVDAVHDAALGAETAREAGAAEEARALAMPRIGGRSDAMPWADITRFYYPLALTSFIGLTVHPMLTFFMGRAPLPVESLAVFPVVHALSFLFRAVGFSFQEAVIALSGRRFENVPQLARFGVTMAAVSSGGMALVAFTPLAGFWFETVSGLQPELAALATMPTRVLVPLPALAVLLAFQQGVLVQGRRTRPISVATGLEVGVIGILFAAFGWMGGLIGVTAAMLALLGGRMAGNAYLVGPVQSVLRKERA